MDWNVPKAAAVCLAICLAVLDYALMLVLVTRKWKTLDRKIILTGRAILFVPLLAILALSFTGGFTLYRVIMAAGFAVIFLADVAITANILAGILVFMVFVVVNGVNLTLYHPGFGWNMAWGAGILAAVLLLYFIIFFRKLAPVYRAAVLVYSLFLFYMNWRAVCAFNPAYWAFSVLVIVGNLAFLVTDFHVGYHNFINKDPNYRVNNNLFYYLSLNTLALSAVFSR